MMNKSLSKIFFVSGVITIVALFASCDLPHYPENNIVPGSNASIEQNAYSPLTIAPVNASLPSDYMRGIDASEVKALEEAGFVFYDEDNSQKDVFEILKLHGVNWIRLRIWNDYTKADTSEWAPYGFNNLNRT